MRPLILIVAVACTGSTSHEDKPARIVIADARLPDAPIDKGVATRAILTRMDEAVAAWSATHFAWTWPARIDDLHADLVDAWGMPLRIVGGDKMPFGAPGWFGVISSGADQSYETSDDLTSWTPTDGWEGPSALSLLRVSPPRGSNGDVVTIHGTGFAQRDHLGRPVVTFDRVVFGKAEATVLRVVSNRQMLVRIPAGAHGSTAVELTGSHPIALRDAFTYVSR